MKKREARKRTPVVTAASPVRAPSPIPVADSMYAPAVDLPTRPLSMQVAASTIIGFSTRCERREAGKDLRARSAATLFHFEEIDAHGGDGTLHPRQILRTSSTSMRLRSAYINVGLSLAVIAVTLLVMEGVARVLIARRGRGKEQNEFAQYQVPDPVLGWRDKPNARVFFRRREYEVELRTNAQGLRDRERSYEGSAFRVLALGDSFPEAYSVPLEQSVTQVLEKRLTSPACPIEVINGGVAGYSTDQEYLAYRQGRGGVPPPFVVLFFFFNKVLGPNHHF